jgi:hypothetical protein
MNELLVNVSEEHETVRVEDWELSKERLSYSEWGEWENGLLSVESIHRVQPCRSPIHLTKAGLEVLSAALVKRYVFLDTTPYSRKSTDISKECFISAFIVKE